MSGTLKKIIIFESRWVGFKNKTNEKKYDTLNLFSKPVLNGFQ